MGIHFVRERKSLMGSKELIIYEYLYIRIQLSIIMHLKIRATNDN